MRQKVLTFINNSLFITNKYASEIGYMKFKIINGEIFKLMNLR